MDNDSDPDSDPLTVTDINGTAVVSGTAVSIPVPNGTVNVDAAGNISFVPDANYNGSVSFPYTISDGNGGSSSATINISVTPVNDAPVAVDDYVTTMLNTPVTFNATDNDDDVDGTIDTTTVDLDPATPGIQNNFTDVNGNVWIVDNSGNVTFTPATDFAGIATIPYLVNDNEGDTSNQANLSVFVQDPELTVTKDDGMDITVPQNLTVGQTITYTINVSNTGNVVLTNITVTDDNATITNPDIASLPVGATTSLTATHLVTQADIDNGYVINSATAQTVFDNLLVKDVSDDADANAPANDNDPTITSILQNPELTVTKDDQIPANATVGDDIVYTIVVTNTGNVTLTNVVLDDINAQIGGSNTITSLSPGNSVTFTATHTITQDDMNNGNISNTAVASTTFNGNLISDNSDDADGVQPGNDDPTISDLTSYQIAEITATLDDNDPSSPTNPSTYFAGDNINYTLSIANTGNVSLSNPVVPAGYISSVDQAGFNVGDTNQNGVIDPDEIWIYTGAHTLSQAEIDAGVYSTQITVNATDPNLISVSDLTDDPATNATNDSTKTYFNLVSELEVKKQDALPQFVIVGNDITYTITIINTGNTTLSNISVNDPNGQNITYAGGDDNNNNQLEPSETWTYTATHTITQDDMDAGFVSNQASVNSTNPAGDPVNDDASDDPDTPEPNDPTVTDIHAYQIPSITTEKIVTGITDNGLIGDSATDVIHYQISVQNTGNVTVNSLQIIDMMITNSGAIVNYNSGDTNNDGYLNVNETWIYNADYTITQDDVDNGIVVNSAVAYAIDSNGTPLDDVSDDPNYVATPGNPDNDNNPTITILTQNPQLEVTKQDVLPTNVNVGEYISYTIVVRNTGNVTLNNVNVTDTNAVMNGVGSTPNLQPGDAVVFTAVHQITQDDMNDGLVINQATGSATDPDNNNIIDLSDDPDTATLNDPTETDLTPYQVVGIEVTLDDNLQTNINNPYNFNVGDVITYTAELSNTGNVSVRPMTPPHYSGIRQNGFNVGDANQNGICDPDEIWVYTTTHTVEQEDIDLGHYDNQISFGAYPANGGPIVSDRSDDPQDMTTTTDDVTITYIGQVGQLNVLKTGVFDDLNANGLANVGETITFTITAENTGNLTIDNINVVDTNAQNVTYISGDANSNGSMDPDEVWIYTAIHTLTQADIDAAKVENQATVTGQDTAGNNISDISDDPNTGTNEDSTIVTVPVHSEITMIKTGIFTDGTNNNGYADVGEVITYTFEVHNAGNQTISNLTIEDANLTAAGATYVSGDINGNNLLDVDENWIFSGTHELTQADIDAGQFINQAMITGEDPQGNTINDLSDDGLNNGLNNDIEGDGEPDDATTTLIPQHPELSLFKTATFNDENGDGLAQVGETISYNFVIENIGDVTLTNINISDDLPGITINGTPIILAPGETDNSTFTAIYTLRSIDIDNGFVSNTANVSGTDPQGHIIEDTSDDGLNFGPNADPDNDGEPDDPTVTETLGLEIMTIFTPNGDGKNETWKILGIQNFHYNVVKVYNRWGNLVYEKNYYTGDWDGTSNGRWTISEGGKLPVSTYFYIIDLGNGHEPFTGYLYLNR